MSLYSPSQRRRVSQGTSLLGLADTSHILTLMCTAADEFRTQSS